MVKKKQFPKWLKIKLPPPERIQPTRDLIDVLGLNTVCSSAQCPHEGECFAEKTATFMILGNKCTRQCRFCAVGKGEPALPDPSEPDKVGEAASVLGLRHVVVTSVSRDDLPDGGAEQFVRTIRAIRQKNPHSSVEVLTPDFGGKTGSIDMVADEGPEVFNHNVETVPRLYARVRPQANYDRSLALLERVKLRRPDIYVKSGLMVGLGEDLREIEEVFADLLAAGCDIVTVGQYLQPTVGHLEVMEFVTPEAFRIIQERALEMGFKQAFCAPLVRSSYKAGEMLKGSS